MSNQKVQLEKFAATDGTKTVSALTASTCSTDGHSAANASQQPVIQHFSAFMTNKTGAKAQYIIQLGEGELRVVSFSKGSVKARLSLLTMHAKLSPKQPANEEAKLHSGAAAAEEGELYWYPLKMMLSLKKSRMLFFETRRQRKEVLEAILTEQGFTNQLDQYSIAHKIGEGCSNPVVIGQHKLTNA